MDYQQLMDRLYSELSDKEMAKRVNVEQMFTLIENVLPVEICLHHQILPLFLDGRHLHLGMVCLVDTAAYEYARRIIAYLNYSLIKQPISAKALQIALSSYLKHHAADVPSSQASRRSPEKPIATPQSGVTAAVSSSPPRDPPAAPKPRNSVEPAELPPPATWPSQRKQRKQRKQQPAPKSKSTPKPAISSEQETYIVDRPETLDEAYLPSEIQLRDGSSPPALSSTAEQNIPKAATQKDSSHPPSRPGSPPPALALDIRHPELPFERLTELSPQHLLPELLGRVLIGNISRLYFEHQPEHGRILWSDSGVLRSAIDPIDKAQLQGVVSELKHVMQLPLMPSQRASHAELEYTYGHSAVLLRMRTTVGQHGENATLQVLQGATLKFYQRQQVARLGQDAIDAAKQVQLKVSELRSRMAALPEGANAPEVLADLAQILRSLGQQVNTLQHPEASPQSAQAVPNQAASNPASPAP
ncbi:MAG: hypothetical protein ACFB5Z_13070 [Elainellaceae cyanobacterium]